ncbi:MAG: carotenoid oxygenase family protein [Alphaproteobacteria bacterium]|nr:carotenoid oxygenase family protein [Alphaproteobacteria bacterium]MBV9694538.1 carotenoid oxygenase family protein [Alphaproteobacteria bacterium]
MNAPVRINPYLTGNFAPLHSEDDFPALKIRGEFPKALRGSYYRNGPNPQFPPRDPNHHWFAGDGMIHALHVGDGKVSYLNRYVHTNKYVLEHAAGRSLFGTFGNPMTSDASVVGKDSGVANTNIVWHAGKLLALEEAHNPYELDPLTLASRGYVDYAGPAMRFTAHPKMDPETGEMVFFGYSAGAGFFTDDIAYGVVDKAGAVTRLDQFKAPYCSMIHDFFVTRNYVAFPVLPLSGSLPRVMQGGPAFAWEPQKGAYVGVMRRDGDVNAIRWFETDPCYVFHPMNMWEEGSVIFVDVMQYANAPLFPNADGSPGRPAGARLVRWTIDLAGKSNAIRQQPLDDIAGEFPRFDERRAGLAYRHGYFAASSTNSDKVVFDAIAHIDHQTGKREMHVFADGMPGEPVFVPRHDGAAEGDGWLVATVYRPSEDRSDFAVFDAANVAAGPVGWAELPRRIPFGFHGNWRPA